MHLPYYTSGSLLKILRIVVEQLMLQRYMPLSKPDLGFHYGLGKESYANNTGSRSKSMQH